MKKTSSVQPAEAQVSGDVLPLHSVARVARVGVEEPREPKYPLIEEYSLNHNKKAPII